MSEARDYILRNILNIFNLSAEPAELSSCSTLDKFVANANIKTVVVICLANKAFKVCLPPEIPKEGVALYISKFESANIPNSFYSFVVKPIAAFKHLNQQIENIYEPILEREENSHLSQIKELKAALMTQAKPRF